MDLFSLECFCVTATQEHISRAADIMHVSQPAMSKIIARVEGYVGYPLFDRSRGKVKLNNKGKLFLETVESIQRELDSGLQRIHALSERNIIRVASSNDNIMSILAEQYFASHPEVMIDYQVLSLEEMIGAFQRSELDFAFSTQPIIAQTLTWTPIGEEEIFLLISDQSPFHGRKTVSFSELQGVEIMCEGKSGDLRNLIFQCCAFHNFIPNIAFASNTDAGRGFPATADRGVLFVPAHRFMQQYDRYEHNSGPIPQFVSKTPNAPGRLAWRLIKKVCTLLMCRTCMNIYTLILVNSLKSSPILTKCILMTKLPRPDQKELPDAETRSRVRGLFYFIEGKIWNPSRKYVKQRPPAAYK